jgi:hypothetical protein
MRRVNGHYRIGALRLAATHKSMCNEAMTMTTPAQLTHVANVEDDSTDEAFEVFKYVKVGGRRGTLIVEREVADDAKQVRLRLRKHNAALSTNIADSMREVEKAIRAQPSRLFRYAASTGWLPDDTGFVTTHGTIDFVKRRQTILSPRRLNDAQRCGAKPEGDFAGWKKEVAVPCGYSDIGITILSAAFAAPVLKIVGRHSFGLNIHGRAKSGKSAMIVAGSTVGGVGREEELPNWAATSAAVGEFCRLYCDRLMPINEVGLIKKKDAYGKIQPTIFQVAEGRERDRHSKSSFATSDESAYHRTIFVSTAEHSFDFYARLAGEIRDEGEHARCTEISAVRNRRGTVIDRWPDSVPCDQRTARQGLRGGIHGRARHDANERRDGACGRELCANLCRRLPGDRGRHSPLSEKRFVASERAMFS